MGYYLLDNPPKRSQFRDPRREPISGVVIVHNSGGRRTSAANLANFIRTRSDAGSYHELGNHRDDWIVMAPDGVEAYGCVTGDNRHAYQMCLTGNDGDFSTSDPATQAGVKQLARRCVDFWARHGITPFLERTLTYDEAHNQKKPGIIHHGVIQPADRSDLWAKSPQRRALDFLLLEEVKKIYSPPEEEEEEMKQILLRSVDEHGNAHVWLVQGIMKVHVPSYEHVDLLRYIGVEENLGPDSSKLLATLGTLPNGLAL